MKEKRKQEKGITLIALVITIIVLLILAGVTLSIVMNTGIVDNSKKAVNTYNAQQAKDKLAMAIYNYRIAQYMNADTSLEDLIAEVGGDAVLDETTGTYEVYVDGYDFTVSENLEITSEDITGESPKVQYTVTIEKGDGIISTTQTRKVTQGKSMTLKAEVESGYVFEKWEIIKGNDGTIAEATNVTTTITPTSDVTVKAIAKIPLIADGNNLNGKANGNLTGKAYTYQNPVIPVGFKTKDTNDAKWKSTDGQTVDDWNKGLVIEDAENDGNEFVWVPVDGSSVKYEKWCTTGTNHASTSNDELPTGVLNESNQINTYYGFYIARYEAGIPEDKLSSALTTANKSERNVSGVPLSKKNQVPWNYIGYTNAKANAEQMYTGDNVKSGLVTGTMWDTTLRWLISSKALTSESEATSNSTTWGNYKVAAVTDITQYSTDGGANWTDGVSTTKDTSASWLLKTGHSDYTKINNIYDLAGNLIEWTNESYSSDCIFRGGCYRDSGNSFPAAYRGKTSTDDCNYLLGFRCALYIK